MMTTTTLLPRTLLVLILVSSSQVRFISSFTSNNKPLPCLLAQHQHIRLLGTKKKLSCSISNPTSKTRNSYHHSCAPMSRGFVATCPQQRPLRRRHSPLYLNARNDNDDDEDMLISAASHDDNEQGSSIFSSISNISIQPIYLLLATAETIFWYYLAPGIDPNSRWFNVEADGRLISQLLDPTVVLTNTPGYAYSSLLLNSFLIVPAVWALLILQEADCQKPKWISPTPFCLAGFFVGGGALIPYMIFRKPAEEVDPSQFSPILKFFEADNNIGPNLLAGLTTIVLGTFLSHVGLGNHNAQEWAAFISRLQSSQFTSLAFFDFIMLSCAIVDPMSDDARRRQYDGPIWPFCAFPLVGPVAWIVSRPKYNID